MSIADVGPAPPAGPLLAIDTSTARAGLALAGEDAILAEILWVAGREQTAALLSEIDHLLCLAGLSPDDLGAVAVATGPGSFNALRVGLSAAKGLAFALGLPVVGVPTLDATAFPHVAGGRPVRAVLAAGRGRLVSGLYRWQDGAARRVGEWANQTVEELAASIVEPTTVCGELDGEPAQRLAALAPAAQIVSPSLGVRRAGCLAELAWARLRRGEADDPAMLEPIYLHGPGGQAGGRAGGETG